MLQTNERNLLIKGLLHWKRIDDFKPSQKWTLKNWIIEIWATWNKIIKWKLRQNIHFYTMINLWKYSLMFDTERYFTKDAFYNFENRFLTTKRYNHILTKLLIDAKRNPQRFVLV